MTTAEMTGTPIPLLDVLYPFAADCAFCGFPDKRHRMADAITENVRAGDSVAMVADNYEVTTAAVEALVVAWNPSLCNWPLALARCAKKIGHRGRHA